MGSEFGVKLKGFTDERRQDMFQKKIELQITFLGYKMPIGCFEVIEF